MKRWTISRYLIGRSRWTNCEGETRGTKTKQKNVAATRRLTVHWLPASLLPTTEHSRERTPILPFRSIFPYCTNTLYHAKTHPPTWFPATTLSTSSTLAFTDRNWMIHFANDPRSYHLFAFMFTRMKSLLTTFDLSIINAYYLPNSNNPFESESKECRWFFNV